MPEKTDPKISSTSGFNRPVQWALPFPCQSHSLCAASCFNLLTVYK